MKSGYLINSAILVLLLSGVVNGQTGYDYTTNAFNYNLILAQTGEVQNTYDTVYSANLEISFMNISNIKNIYIKATKTDTGTDMINEVIDMQNTESASVPVQIDQDKVILSFGNIVNKGLEFDLKMQDLMNLIL